MGALDKILHGAIDMHCHSGPSPFPRRIDHAEAARLADEAGMRAIVVKSHHHSTVTDVLALQPWALKDLSVEVFGGIALNGPVGGLNPSAVELALRLGGKVVWFPTISSSNHICHHAEHPDLKFPKATVSLRGEDPQDIIGEDGDLKQEVRDILGLIGDTGAILAGGHMSPEQILILLETAKGMGLERMVVNHPEYVIEADPEQVRKFAELGAKIEHCLCMYDDDSAFYHWDANKLLEWIELVGPEHTTLASDLGQVNNPLPTESFRKVCGQLLDLGLTATEIRMMICDNPAQLLGLD